MDVELWVGGKSRGTILGRRPTADLLDEQPDDLGVELAPGTALELETGLFGAASGAVRAVAGDGAEAVSHRDDPRFQRNRLTAQPSRVAISIKAFVVVQHRGSNILQRRHLPHELIPDPRVQLDDAALLRGQTGRFEQYPLRDAQLADVVKQRSEDQFFSSLRLEVEPVGHRQDVFGDVIGVPTQLGILELDGVGQHADRGQVGAAQVAVQP